MKLIQDIKPARHRLLDAVADEKAYKDYETERALQEAEVAVIVKALYDRNIPFSYIFGRYYEFEEAGNGRMMTVEDAQLAGYDGEPRVESF